MLESKVETIENSVYSVVLFQKEQYPHNSSNKNNRQEVSQLDFPIGISLPDKIKLLRKREKLSQQGLCDLIGIPRSVLAKFESGHVESIGSDTLIKIINHPQLLPYAMWLLIDDLTDKEVEQSTQFLRDFRKGGE